MNYLPSDRLSQTESESSTANMMEPSLRLHQQPAPTETLLNYSTSHSALFQSASQLDLKTKQALCQLLLTQLGVEQAREILDFAKLELAAREGRVSMIRKPPERCTRLVLKKDYSFQKLNLAHPTQYFVYLVRRKPKLDRYIGALFYIPQGFPLSYFPDADGRIVFTPPNNLFKLIDSQSLQTQVVRLVSVDPPPPDYTFDRGQEDTPEIFLCLDYLDPITYEPLASERYHYPSCMYEGGKLDRYRWKVEPLVLPLEVQTRLQSMPSAQSLAAAAPLESPLLPVVQRRESLSVSSQTDQAITQLTALGDNAAIAASTPAVPAPATPRPKKFILTDLPKANTATYYLANSAHSNEVLERLRLYAALSELATPHAKWIIEQKSDKASIYRLIHSKTKRLIIQFSVNDASITLQNSFPVIMTAFRDLARSASQTSQRMTREQQTLMHKVHVEMGLPHKNPLEILEKLFGVVFSDAPSA